MFTVFIYRLYNKINTLMDKPWFSPRAWVGAFCSAKKNPSLSTSLLLSSQKSEPEHKLFAHLNNFWVLVQAFGSSKKSESDHKHLLKTNHNPELEP